MSDYQEAPIPNDEKERLVSLYRLNILDTPPEERFDKITELALALFKVPISTVTLVDSKREWFKSCQGLSAREGERAISFCGHAVVAEDMFIVPDTKEDPRFAKNPMVIGKPYIRFYAAIPLKAADGKRIGAFCLKDYKPRILDLKQQKWLKVLASWAEIEINAHELSLALASRQQAEAKLSEVNDILKLLNKTLRHDLLNQLTVIRGNLDFLISGKRKKSYIEDLSMATNQSLALIEQIGRLESTVSTGIYLKPYFLRDIIEKTSRLFPSIKFKIEGEEIVLADEALFSVIENLIRNARMHGKTKKIEVKIIKEDDFVKVKIADFGVGIPKEVKEKLFAEGFKYGESGNHGLGLYIAKRTIKRYGGDITVSDNKPKGAVFTLYFSGKI